MGKFNETNFSPEFMALLGGGATHEQAEEILAAIAAIDMSSIDLSAIGSPSTAASNTITSNAHSKLNWLLSVLETVNTNTVNSSLGIPTTAASNATSAVAHAKLNWLLSTLNTVNTNTATANLGAPATAASNATSAVAHAKLNWLMSTLATVSSSSGGSSGIMMSSGDLFTSLTIGGDSLNLSVTPGTIGPLSNELVTITGKGRLYGFTQNNPNASYVRINIDNKLYIDVSGSSRYYLQKIPFKSFVTITGNSPFSSAQYKLLYEAL